MNFTDTNRTGLDGNPDLNTSLQSFDWQPTRENQVVSPSDMIALADAPLCPSNYYGYNTGTTPTGEIDLSVPVFPPDLQNL